MSPDDDELAAAASHAVQHHARIRGVLDAALGNATSLVLVENLDAGGDAEDRFAQAVYRELEDLDEEERLDAIVMLLGPVAEQRARDLRADMRRRLASIPEVPGAEP